MVTKTALHRSAWPRMGWPWHHVAGINMFVFGCKYFKAVGIICHPILIIDMYFWILFGLGNIFQIKRKEINHHILNHNINGYIITKTQSIGPPTESHQSNAIEKSVLKLLRSIEYILSAVHSYTPASIWVAGSISILDFTLSFPMYHSCT